MTDFERFDDFETREEGSSALPWAITFLLIGLGIGAVTALLLTPKTGTQMRRMLRRKYEDARERVDDLQDKAGEWVDRGGKWAKQARSRVAPIAKRFAD
jgi:gas vesicle protein